MWLPELLTLYCLLSALAEDWAQDIHIVAETYVKVPVLQNVIHQTIPPCWIQEDWKSYKCLRQEMGLLSREPGRPKRKPTDPYIWAPRNKVPKTERWREGGTNEGGERRKEGRKGGKEGDSERLPTLDALEPCPNPLYWASVPIVHLVDAKGTHLSPILSWAKRQPPGPAD